MEWNVIGIGGSRNPRTYRERLNSMSGLTQDVGLNRMSVLTQVPFSYVNVRPPIYTVEDSFYCK